MPTVAFATCRERPAPTADDALVARHLPPEVALVGVPWDAPDVDWEGFAAVVVRSTWDYHLRPESFAAWVERLEAGGVRMWNPPERLRWNLDKTYLRDLEASGVRVVPTRFLDAGERVDLAALVAEAGWTDAVIKPTVGASSWGLSTVDRAGAAARQGALDAMLAAGGAMVQPLVPEVAAAGEWSIVFLAGEPSHAVIKRAAPGEVRVQSDYGGTVAAAEPPTGLRRWASRVVEAAGGGLLYARVDVVETGEGPLLMELELIEPQLFLGSAPGAARRFAEAIVAAL